MDSAPYILPAALVHAGLASLALAQGRHYRAVWRSVPSRTRSRSLRLLGAFSLLAGVLACALRDGWAVGAVTWVALLTPSALALTLALAYRPTLAAWSAGAASIVAVVGSLLR